MSRCRKSRLVDHTSQVVELKTLEALAQPGFLARVALCGKLLAAKQQIGEQVSKSEAELLGLTEPTRDSRAEAETIVKYLVENGLSGYMMKVLDMVRGRKVFLLARGLVRMRLK